MTTCSPQREHSRPKEGLGLSRKL
ncbi:hypothetical protein E2C01_082773 [Portunus trituberculatus]|uniref:Uncharacterized protein n=1 Tax=Portunus trituberculatus TaxID=210409 RepID=A0A5B7J067_PORTR|nr:hypothetical protein [Portunus trituberculatus]